MNKHYLNGLKHGLGILTILIVFFGIVYATGFHSANEIIGGIFQGDYEFNGSVNISGNLYNDNVVSSNMIISFNTSSCPSGWTQSSQVNSTGSDLVPEMTDFTSPSGEVTTTGTTNGANYGWKAFDNTEGAEWEITTTGSVAYNFTTPTLIKGYNLKTFSSGSDYRPRGWTFEGHNGTAWVVLDSRSSQSPSTSSSTWNYYNISNSNYYETYRFNINDKYYTYTKVIELEFIGLDQITTTCIKN